MADERVSLRIDAEIDSLSVSDKAVDKAQKDLNKKELTAKISKLEIDSKVGIQKKLNKLLKDKDSVLSVRIQNIDFTAKAIEKARRKLNKAFKDDGITIDTKIDPLKIEEMKYDADKERERVLREEQKIRLAIAKVMGTTDAKREKALQEEQRITRAIEKTRSKEAEDRQQEELENHIADNKVLMLQRADAKREMEQAQKDLEDLSSALEKTLDDELSAAFEAQQKAYEESEKLFQNALDEMDKDFSSTGKEAAESLKNEINETYKEIERDNADLAKSQKKDQEDAAKAEQKRAKDFEKNFNKALKNIGSFGKKIFKGFGSILKSIGKTFLGIFKSIIHTIGSLLKKAFNGILDIAKSIGSKLKEGLSKGTNGIDDFKEKLKGIAGLMLSAFSIKGLVDFGKESIELGSDIVEVKNIYEKAFGDLSYIIEDFSERSLKATGLTQLQYQRYSGIFGAMGKSMGLTSKQALKLSTDITKLTGDIASYLNLDYDEAFNKLKAIYSGRMQPLQNIGVQMSSAALGQYALEKGIDKVYSKMSVQERLMVRYAYVLDKLSLANNDFIDTSKSFANQMRLLTGQWKEFLSIVGKAIINIITPMIRLLNSLLTILMTFGKKFEEWTIKIFGDANNISGAAVSDLEETSEDMEDALDGVGDSAEENADKVKKSLMGFDEINKLDKDTNTSTASTDEGNLDDLMKQLGIEESLNNLMNEKINLLDEFDKKAEEMFKRLEDLWGWFKAGFLNSLQLTGFEDLIDIFNTLKKSLKEIHKSMDSILGFETISSLLGKFTGSVVGIGANLGDGLLRGFNTFITEHGEEALQRWKKVVQNISDTAINLSEIFRSKQFERMVSDGINIFNTIKAGAKTAFTQITKGLTNILKKENVLDNLSKAFTQLDKVVSYVADSITGFLEKFFDYLDTEDGKKRFEPLKIAIEKVELALNSLWELGIKPLLDWLNSDEGVEAVSNIIVAAGELIASVIEKLIKFTTDLLVVIHSYLDETVELTPQQEKLKTALDNVAKAFETAWSFAKDLFAVIGSYLTGDCSKLTDEQQKLKDKLDTVMEVLKTIYETAKDLFAVIGSYITGDASKLTDNQKDIKDKIDDIITKVQEMWQDYAEPFIKWITSDDGLLRIIDVANQVAGAIEAVAGTFKGLWDLVGFAKDSMVKNDKGLQENKEQLIEDALNVYGGITGVDVSGAKEAKIKQSRDKYNSKIDKQIANPLKRKHSDYLARGAAKIIGAMTGQEVKSWEQYLGEKKLPAYATGGYVRPNQPQLAVVGDNRTQGEIISPVDKMAEVFENVLAKYAGQTNTEPQPIILNNYTTLDGRVIYQETKTLSYNESNRQGSRQFR